MAGLPRQPVLGSGSFCFSGECHSDLGGCTAWSAGGHHHLSPNLQRAFRVQSPYPHDGHGRRVARLLWFLEAEFLLRWRPVAEVLAGRRNPIAPRSPAGGSAQNRFDRRPDGRRARSPGKMLVEHQSSILRVERPLPSVRRSLLETGLPSLNVASPASTNETSRFGPKTKSRVYGVRRSARWRNSSTVGHNISRSITNTEYGTLGSLLHVHWGRSRPPSSPSWDRNQDPDLDVCPGQIL